MKTVFTNEDFNLTFAIDVTEGKEVLEEKLMNWLLNDGEEAFMDTELYATNSTVDIHDNVVIFWGGNGCLGFEKVNIASL